MSLLYDEYLQDFCPDKWVAKSYSEYMFSVAEAQATALENYAILSADDKLDELVNATEDACDDAYKMIDEAVTKKLVESNEMRESSFNRTSDAYQKACAELLTEGDSQVTAGFAAIRSLFPETVTSDDVTVVCNLNVDEAINAKASFRQLVSQAVNRFMTSQNIKDTATLTLLDGFVNMRDALESVTGQAYLSLNENVALDAVNGADQAIGKVETSWADILNTFKTDYASSLAWACGFNQLASDKTQNWAEDFDAQISTLITDTKTQFSASVNHVKNLVNEAKGSVSSFFDWFSDELGLSRVKDDLFTTVDATDVYQYTGASPLGAINFKSLSGIAEAGAKVVLGVGAGILAGARALLKRGFAKARPYIKAITTNPEDIKVVDTLDRSYTCTNFAYNLEGSTNPIAVGMPLQIVAKRGTDVQKWNEFWDVVTDRCVSDEWISIDSTFGQTTFRIRKIASTAEVDSLPAKRIDFDMKFKPKCLNYESLRQSGLARLADEGTTQERVKFGFLSEETWSAYSRFVNIFDTYAEDDCSEQDKFMGFVAALILQSQLGRAELLSLSDQLGGIAGVQFDKFIDIKSGFETSIQYGVFDLTDYKASSTLGAWVPDTVTNLDFLKVTSGYNDYFSYTNNQGTFNYFKIGKAPQGPNGVFTNDTPFGLQLICGPLIMCYLIQQWDKAQHPSDYLFLPYCKGTLDFTGGRYSINTDGENANIANTMANAILAVTVIAITTLVLKKAIKVRRKKKIMKLTTQQQQVMAKIWNGEALTKKDTKRYLRATDRLTKLDAVSSGLAGSPSVADVCNKIQGMIPGANPIPASDDTLLKGDDYATQRICSYWADLARRIGYSLT